jgi:hypothetical protein
MWKEKERNHLAAVIDDPAVRYGNIRGNNAERNVPIR